VPTAQPFDGLSLLPLAAAESGTAPAFAHRVRFTETEYTPVGVATPEGKMSTSGIAKAAEMYEIDPVTDLITVRHEHLKPMLTIRQYAAVGDEYLLAALPYFRSGGLSHMFVVLRKEGGVPQLLAGPPTPDAPEDLRRVWDAMQINFAGSVPSSETYARGVADSAVAQRGQAVTPQVTK
jgi:hypothetical protein